MDSSASTYPVPLTAAEEAEIAECERIVAFAEQVMTGTHPRIKIPSRLLEAQQASNTTPPNPAAPALPNPVIDFRRDYYRDLGLQEHVKQDSIIRAYQGRLAGCSPDFKLGRSKHESGNLTTIRKAEKIYQKVNEAYEILADPELRKKYDERRIRARSPPNESKIVRSAYRRGGRKRGRGGGVGNRG
ncbi:hypothetical protein ONS95_000137 [Cadophora gregata]|uniref:uncharacterized protein n=1 Tax=Cadophora gregata TaxID=51156 RepID=UPI0026DD4CEA|nr:uncharacterized protein ONS95_000137 [Cadophora gregata]KAK0115590.1 hypothetical protein ONS96_014040 [Cadophora gregata f. sp. sojae]KAK0128154.1 hypothetical protein ONS95_000137 [Cadophora gregata]